jgi:DNA-binding CsgD family transcriptional regulator
MTQLEEAALSTLDMLDMGVILLSRKAQVLNANRSARQVLKRGDALWMTPEGRLSARRSGDATALRTALDRVRPEADGAIPLTVERSGGGYLPAVLRGLAALHPDSVAALFVRDPEEADTVATDVLSALYGLTPAESRLASLLAGGHSLAEIADQLEVSLHTVRTHLRRIFDKTGVHRQSELVRLLMRGPSALRF